MIRETKDGYEIVCGVCGETAYTTTLNRHSFEAYAFVKGWEVNDASPHIHYCPKCAKRIFGKRRWND